MNKKENFRKMLKRLFFAEVWIVLLLSCSKKDNGNNNNNNNTITAEITILGNNNIEQ